MPEIVDMAETDPDGSPGLTNLFLCINWEQPRYYQVPQWTLLTTLTTANHRLYRQTELTLIKYLPLMLSHPLPSSQSQQLFVIRSVQFYT